MNRLTLSTCLATSLLWIAAPPVFAIPFGSIEDWTNFPNQTISLDDKDFVWLADSGNWNGTERVNLASIPSVNAHALGIDTLESYLGPFTLSFSYRIDITSSNVFAAVGMDQDFLFPNVTTYKDIYLTESSFLADVNNPPGSADISLFITNFTPVPVPPVLLPPIQSLWVRDTIVLDGTGSVQSISNTFVQTVPEPSSLVLTAFGIGLAAFLPRRLRRVSRARRGIGLAA